MSALQHYALVALLAAVLACSGSRDSNAQARQPTRTPIDACTLLTQTEAEEIMGTTVAAPEKGPSRCTYAAENGRGDLMLHQLPLVFGSKEEFHAYLVKDTEKTNERIKKRLARMGATAKESTVEPVPEVGSPAYYVDPNLLVLKDGRVLSIVAADRKQAVAVAAKTLPRF